MTNLFIFNTESEGCNVILDEIKRVQKRVGILSPPLLTSGQPITAATLQLQVGDLLQLQAETTPFRVSQRYWRINAQNAYELVISLTPP